MKLRNQMNSTIRRGAARALALGPLTFLLVAAAGCPSLFESEAHRAPAIKQAVVGRDGARTVSAASTVVNAYAALDASAAAGATTITVDSLADLTTNFSRALAQGDLLLIMQMQGATINTTDTVDYGSIASEADLASAGRYEFVGVEGVIAASNQITLACPLRHAYTAAGKTQVVRVPQYTTLTIDENASIGTPAWNGATGGVVAVHAETRVQLDGSIDVSARGFRGGAVDNSSAAEATAVTIYRSGTASQGAEKGESIAGYQGDYANGRYGRGAPANGGGGGNSHNAGGGGGANAGDPAGWRLGQGVMSSTVEGAAAWTLDPGYINNPVAANTRTSSQGGGRGGYSYSDADQNALTVGPGNASWAGNSRREVGGLGGRPLASSPATRLFLGGGGGAGDRNNGSTGSEGGNGGGLVFLITGSVAGTGSISANGADAPPSPGAPQGDALGGGGGGGTVVINAASLSAVTISVKGGAGGKQTGSGSNLETEGPGGGGGGGYIAVSGTGSPALSAAGGLGGTTNRPALSEFPSNGATAGNSGITTGSASSFFYCGALPVTTITGKPANPTADTTGDFTFTNASSPVTYQCKLDAADWAACPAGYTTPALGEGSHTLSVRATDAFGNVEATPPSHTWVVDTTAPDTRIDNKPTDPSMSPTGSFTFGSNETPVTYACKLDAADWAACPASFTTQALSDGSHTLSARATDAAGNVDATPATYTWTVSTTFRTTIATHPTDSTEDTTGDFTFTNTQSPVTYECKLDASDFAACPASYTTPALADGSHTLSVRATLVVPDAGVLVEDPPVTFTWTVGTTKLITTIVTHPTNPTEDATGDFTFTNTQSPVTYECKLDNDAWAPCGASYTTPALADGAHTLSVRATMAGPDGGVIVEAPPVTFTWTVSSGKLVTTIATHPANPSNDTTGDFTFTNPRSPVSYECKLDSGAWAPCGPSFTTPALADGTHTLSVRATLVGADGGSLVEDPPVVYTWVVDTLPPETVIATKPSNPTSDSIATFTFVSDERPVTFACKLDAADWTPCPATTTTSALAIGTHTLSVRATDAAGNVDGTPATYAWTVLAGGVDGGVVIDAQPGEANAIIDSGARDGARADLAVDTRQIVPEPGRDDAGASAPDSSPEVGAPGVEPSPDAGIVQTDTAAPANPDTAVPATSDAAPSAEAPKLLGGGFCTLVRSRSASPVSFLFLALGGLALLRRRR
jgi:large repetitive protein